MSVALATTRTLAASRRFWYAATLVISLVVAGFGVSRLLRSGGADFTEYAMLNPSDIPAAIATAADGSVWFTIDFTDAIGVVRGGKVERLKKPKASLDPEGIAVASDGTVWYTDSAAKQVSRITPTGEIVSIDVGTPVAKLGRIAIAADGAAWFAEASSYSITRVKDGKLQRHIIESMRGGPFGVAVSPDGAVWSTLQSGNQILRIATDGTMTTFDVPTRGSVPSDIAVDNNGDVWFIEFRGNKLGRLRDGRFEEYPVAEESAALTGLAVAPDGSVWFGMLRSSSLGRLKNGKITRFDLPRKRARPYGVASDREGNIWYTDITGYVGMLPARHAR